MMMTGFIAVDLRDLAKELAPVPDPLEIQGNDLRFVVVGKVLEEVRAVQGKGIPVADGLAEIDTELLRIDRQVAGMAAALTGEGDRTALGRGRDPSGEPELGIVNSHAVGADDTEPAPFRDLLDFLLESDTFLLSRLLEAGGEDMHILVARSDTVLQCRRYPRRRNGNDDEIHFLRQGEEIRVDLETLYLIGPRIDGIETALITEVLDDYHQVLPAIVRGAFRTDNGDALGCEHRISERRDHASRGRRWFSFSRRGRRARPQQ